MPLALVCVCIKLKKRVIGKRRYVGQVLTTRTVTNNGHRKTLCADARPIKSHRILATRKDPHTHTLGRINASGIE